MFIKCCLLNQFKKKFKKSINFMEKDLYSMRYLFKCLHFTFFQQRKKFFSFFFFFYFFYFRYNRKIYIFGFYSLSHSNIHWTMHIDLKKNFLFTPFDFYLHLQSFQTSFCSFVTFISKSFYSFDQTHSKKILKLKLHSNLLSLFIIHLQNRFFTF